MSTPEKQSFERRVADVFGALDSIAPKQEDSSLRHTINDSPPEEDGSERENHSTESQAHSDPQRRWTPSSSHASPKIRESRERNTRTRQPQASLETSRYRPGHRRSKHNRPAKVPDFVANSAKWTKYDLSEDGTQDLSEEGLTDDQVNKCAAFQFLEDMKKIRADRNPADSGSGNSSVSHKLMFKPKHLTTSKDESRHSQPAVQPAKFGSAVTGGSGPGVLKMAEYVVGGKDSSRRRQPKLKVVGRGESEDDDETGGEDGNSEVKAERSVKRQKTSTAVVCLSHLDEEIED